MAASGQNKIYDILGVAAIDVGDPGDGVMGSTLTTYSKVTKDTVQFNYVDPEPLKIECEDLDFPYRIIDGSFSDINLQFGLYGLAPADMVELFGGSVDGVSGAWIPSNTPGNVYKSVQITCKDSASGKRMILKFPYCHIRKNIGINLGKGQVGSIGVIATPMVPQSALGVDGNIMELEPDADA